MDNTPFVDAHCHLVEFKYSDIKKLIRNTIIIAVSEDFESSLKTLKITNNNVIPCVGIHPWNIKEDAFIELEKLEKLIADSNISCMGEVGLDKKFVAHTWKVQVKIFNRLVEIAKEYELILNLHAAGAWKDVFERVKAARISKAIFHWYTGPFHLLNEIVNEGYMITVNPSIIMQKKQRELVMKMDLRNVLSESDGPYKYRGLYLTPSLIPKLISYIASLKGLNEEYVRKIIYDNLRRYFDFKVSK